MNSICLSRDDVAAVLPVLGLDVAKASVQAELRIAGNNKVRFGFAACVCAHKPAPWEPPRLEAAHVQPRARRR